MYTARNYVKVSSAEEAWQLNQKRANAILGGGCWMRLGKRRYDTLIDLCDLGLDQIEESEGVISIGAMATLRQLEESPLLQKVYGAYFKDCTRHIVGVQFRNCATVGGSIYGRFGFSDVLTLFLALDCEVELYRAGRMPLAQFAAMPYDRDILTHICLRKTPGLKVQYQSVRATQTDFPILTCAAARTAQGQYRFAIGARPMKAVLVTPDCDPAQLPAAVQAAVKTGSNLRGSAEYRTHLTGVLVRRAVAALEN